MKPPPVKRVFRLDGADELGLAPAPLAGGASVGRIGKQRTDEIWSVIQTDISARTHDGCGARGIELDEARRCIEVELLSVIVHYPFGNAGSVRRLDVGNRQGSA